MSNLFAELKRRNVFRVGIAYIVLAWLVLQVADVIIGNIAAPEWLFKFILLLLALGFPFAIFFAWAFELTPEGVKRESEVDRSQSITRQTGRKLDFTIIAILAAAVAYFAYDKFVLGQTAEPTAHISVAREDPPPAGGEPAAPEPSIAVLPFVNMSDDRSNEYFSDGISEEILNSLANVRQLKVAGRTSSFAFKDKNEDLRVIGDALGVDHILEGSVRKAGNRVRITAQLIQAEDGFHLWSETFDRELDDVFAIQDEIANAILEQLKAELLGAEIAVTHTTPTDPEAYDKYLIAKQRIYARTRATLEDALSLLEEAIGIDPGFAPAHAQLGITILLLRDGSYGDLSQEDALRRSKPHLDTALELDPNLAEGWAGLGLYYQTASDAHEEAVAALEKALALNPNLLDASNWLQAEFRFIDPERALNILEDIVARDPLYRPGVINLVNAWNIRGMLDKSAALIERIEPLLPNEPWLMRLRAQTLLDRGQYAEAYRLAEQVYRLTPEDFGSSFVYADSLFRTHQWERLPEIELPIARAYGLYLLGRREEPLAIAHQLAGNGVVFPLLDLLAGYGRFEELLKFVEQRWPDLDAYEAAYPPDTDGYGEMNNIALAYLKTGNDPRFRDAMERVRKAHEQAYAQGVESQSLHIQQAAYLAMRGELSRAIDYVERAVERGFGGPLRIAEFQPQLEPLEGDPRFEAIQDRMIAKVNAERAKLGLESVGP